jgi:hypothetical protein
MGDGLDLVVNNPDGPAWLQYPVVQPGGATNLTVNAGTVSFWYAPGWSSTNLGGFGPGEFARLLEVGGFTPDSSFGWWSIYVDGAGANLYFSAQTNDLSSNLCTYVTAPIAWATNVWHCLALTYSATNTALYLDGALAATGPALTNYPGANALANGFFVGSDSNGVFQAQGMIDDLYTYAVPLDPATLYDQYNSRLFAYLLNPFNRPEISSAGSNPSTNAAYPDAITGSGDLQWVTHTATCSYGTNEYQVWITNVTAAVAGGGVVNVTFTIAGGEDGCAYDVFAIGALTSPISNGQWSWMGQGYHCNTYTLPITGSADAFLILGTPLDSDGSDLTDAYQYLVSKTNPSAPYSNPDGILVGWEVLLGLNPNNSNLTDLTKRANYGYTPADWLNGVTGVKAGTVNLDNEGNVTSVSQ